MQRIREHLPQLRQTLNGHHWVELAEYAALAGSAVGTVAAAASQQVVCAAAPLTLAIGLNLVNRHRFDRSHRQRTGTAIALVDQLTGDLESVRDSVQDILGPCVDPIELQKELAKIHQSLNLLDSKSVCLYAKVYDNLKAEIDLLRGQLTAYSEPFDINEIKSKLGSLNTEVRELTHRPGIDPARFDELYRGFVNLEQRNREVVWPYLKNLIHDVKQLQQADVNLSSKLNGLSQKFNARPELSQITKLQRVVGGLNESVAQLQQTEVLAQLFAEIENITYQLSVLTEQFNHRPELQLLQELRGEVAIASPDPKLLDRLQVALEVRIDESVRMWTGEINSLLQTNRSYNYQLVIDSSGCRAALLEAISKASERLIIVSPWLRKQVFNDLRHHLEAALNRGVQIQIGWGYETEIGKPEDTQQPIAIGKSGWSYHKERDKQDHYSALPDFIALKKRGFSLSLHLLGTHENFLVCDRAFALIGSHHLLSADSHSKQREAGLRTNDPRIIAELIQRFDSARDFAKNGAVASLN